MTIRCTTVRRGNDRSRDGIVLLVVLGMLTLFSVLGVSYLVFTSRQRSAAVSISRSESREFDGDQLLGDALEEVLVGSTTPDSSLWGHDLLGDLYGMRDGVLGQMTPQVNFVVADSIVAPNVLLNDFVRVPTELFRSATYPNRRSDHTTLPERVYPANATPTFERDDEVAGRILTFRDGPLAGLSFRVLRSFGNHVSGTVTNNREVLSGQVVLDMRPHLGRSITVESLGETNTLARWIEKSLLPTADPDHDFISRLFYNSPPETSTAAVPLSDFYLNGGILNGPGLGFDRERTALTNPPTGGYNLNEVISTNLSPVAAAPPANAVVGGAAFEGGSTGTDVPVAIQGHYATYRRRPEAAPTSAPLGYLQDLPAGDVDEPYDAPDEQNLWLSYFPTNELLGASSPSFVRPGLLHWLINQQSGSLDTMSQLRLQQILRAVQRSTLRPLPIRNDNTSVPVALSDRAEGVLQLDYSDFTGSNDSDLGRPSPIDGWLNFNETDPAILSANIRRLVQALAGGDSNGDGYPDWDVDNNGDGIPDSVWIDAGLPLTESEDGTLVKPLVAYLIEDLGGRVDVNLAGNLVQARNAIQKSASGVLYRTGGVSPTVPTTIISDLPAGFGYGPAEINLRPLFGPSMSGNGPLDLLRTRLTSRTFSSVEYVAAGHLIDPITGSGNDLMGVLRQPYLPNLHSTANAHGLPVDKFGRSSIALGIDGGSMVANASVAVQNAGQSAGDSIDDPYELVSLPGDVPDRMFTLTDLEAMLRFNDFDRDALDSELTAITQNNLVNQNERREFANSVTTISSSAAVNTGTLPMEYRVTNDANTAVGMTSVFDDAVRSLPPNTGADQFDLAQRNALLMQLLPQEILSGGKLNLNRPFGNGVDDDGDGVVDDPEELRTAAQTLFFYRDFTGTTTDTFYTTPFSDLTPGEPGPVSAGGAYPEPTPQAWFARHLYVMAMTLVRNLNNADAFDFSAGAPPVIDPSNQTFRRDDLPGTAYGVVNTPEEEFRAWTLAQWAINVADFRDPDSIMSRFDYDVYPFDGWDIQATPLTFRTVWGMEYPELALEESLAMHDRRVRDTTLDPSGEERFSGGSFMDDDTDQWRIPQGSLFLELRSTRSPDFLRAPTSDTDPTSQAWAVPTELYSQVDTDPGAGVQNEYMLDLARTAPDRNPVWRIAITPAHADPVRGNLQLSADEMLQPVGSSLGPFSIAPNRIGASLRLDQPDFFGLTIPLNQQVDRVIWFTNIDPDNGLQRDGSTSGAVVGGQNFGDFTAGDGFVDFAPLDSQNIEKIFYNRFAATDYPFQVTTNDYLGQNLTEVHLRGGQYAVIGPRAITHVGSLQSASGTITNDATTGEPLVPYADYESPQRFLLGPSAFEHRLFTNSRSTPTVAGGVNSTIRNTVGVIAAANVPTGFTGPPIVGTTQGIGVNVSEPLPYPVPAGPNSYYPTPTEQLKADFPLDAYYDYDAGAGAMPDQPFDQRVFAELFKVFNATAEQTGTRERFKTAYLQRLADPTQPHDENLNPYISVDYISIDLTVFNGSEGNAQRTDMGPPAVTEWIDTGDPDPLGTAPEERFATRYKTGNTIFQGVAASTTENLSHSVNTFPPPITPRETVDLGGHVPFFPFALNLQVNVHPDKGTATPPVATAPDNDPGRAAHSSTLGYANASYGRRWRTTGTADQRYAGMPVNNYFSAATWLNRAYVSPGEMMWVPTTSAGRFGAAFGTATADTGFTAGNVFASQPPPHLVGDRTDINQVFPHLWNYYSSDPNSFVNSPNLHRILSFVDVPAPYDFENDFVSTNRDIEAFPSVTTAGQSTFGGLLNYTTLGGATATGNPNSWTNTGAASRAFWLNRMTVEAFRTPFNILQPQYRRGRINLNTIKSPSVYRALMEGASDSTDPPFGAFVGDFVNSRRGYVPALSADEPLTQVGATTPQFERTKPTQFSGAFRPPTASDLAPLPNDRVNPLQRTMLRPSGVTGTFATRPLFEKPLGGTTAAGEMRDRSVLQNQVTTTRLNNLASDQSNTFAVWITVGLFQVDGNLHVGQELGGDRGQTRRFQSFHIIDRSVPVMYEPGQLNNAMETVVLSRKLN